MISPWLEYVFGGYLRLGDVWESGGCQSNSPHAVGIEQRPCCRKCKFTGFPLFRKTFAASLVLAGSALLAACQTGGAPGGSNTRDNSAQADSEPIRESELRAYCPPVRLREGTAFFRTYEGNARDDPARLVYQASISDATRACDYRENTTVMTVALAGKVVPGPRGRAGTITMPIRVVAVRGDEVVYSKLFKHAVSIPEVSGATQFLFTDPNVVIPGGVDRNVELIVGYDEGPEGSP